jgi:uncharacterized protein
MDRSEAIKIVQRYLLNVAGKYQIENAIIFGSYARGEQKPDSDIDLAIVFTSIDDIIDLQVELLKIRTDEDLLIEPHPFSKNDFEISNPVVSDILKTGIEIPTPAA